MELDNTARQDRGYPNTLSALHRSSSPVPLHFQFALHPIVTKGQALPRFLKFSPEDMLFDFREKGKGGGDIKRERET